MVVISLSVLLEAATRVYLIKKTPNNAYLNQSVPITSKITHGFRITIELVNLSQMTKLHEFLLGKGNCQGELCMMIG